MEADVYWRRRLFALAVGFAVFGVLAWAVGGASGSHQAAATTALSSPPAQPTVTPVTTPSATPSPTPSPAGPAGARGKRARKPAAGHARHAAAAAKAGPRQAGSGCPVPDVVLSLTASGNSYGPRERPSFGVSVVSTDSQPCTLDTGSRHLAVVIESGGVRVWGSADCAGRAGASDATKLTRGVPVQLSFTWNRTLSAPGCRGAKTAARPGTYTVTASDGRLRSRTEVFVLR